MYMQRCLQLAELGASYVAPNPMVGSVIVCGDKIIGEGFHQRYGEPHAEPNAINDVKDKSLLSQCTLYVNLEPCSHFGKTPPCADLIVSWGIPRVVIGTLDPNPQVAGKGVARMEAAGIEVTVGVMENECRELNKRFFIFQEQNRPFILLKWAQTQNGFIDKIRTDVSQPPLIISNEITKQLTHKMRSENQAIMVGTNTVLLDNPSLTVRNWSGRSPVRLAIDRFGRIPNHFNILDGSISTIIFTEMDTPNSKNLVYEKINFHEDILPQILQKIYQHNIHSVLVEGGAQLTRSFIKAELWDETNIEISPITISEGVEAPALKVSHVLSNQYDGHDWLYFVS